MLFFFMPVSSRLESTNKQTNFFYDEVPVTRNSRVTYDHICSFCSMFTYDHIYSSCSFTYDHISSLCSIVCLWPHMSFLFYVYLWPHLFFMFFYLWSHMFFMLYVYMLTYDHKCFLCSMFTCLPMITNVLYDLCLSMTTSVLHVFLPMITYVLRALCLSMITYVLYALCLPMMTYVFMLYVYLWWHMFLCSMLTYDDICVYALCLPMITNVLYALCLPMMFYYVHLWWGPPQMGVLTCNPSRKEPDEKRPTNPLSIFLRKKMLSTLEESLFSCIEHRGLQLVFFF